MERVGRMRYFIFAIFVLFLTHCQERWDVGDTELECGCEDRGRLQTLVWMESIQYQRFTDTGHYAELKRLKDEGDIYGLCLENSIRSERFVFCLNNYNAWEQIQELFPSSEVRITRIEI